MKSIADEVAEELQIDKDSSLWNRLVSNFRSVGIDNSFNTSGDSIADKIKKLKVISVTLEWRPLWLNFNSYKDIVIVELERGVHMMLNWPGIGCTHLSQGRNHIDIELTENEQLELKNYIIELANKRIDQLRYKRDKQKNDNRKNFINSI